MKVCPCCSKELCVPMYAEHNVETYRESVVVVTECCNKAVKLMPIRTYIAYEYIGDKNEDSWGTPIERI